MNLCTFVVASASSRISCCYFYFYLQLFLKFNCLQSSSLLFAQNTGFKLENTGVNKINKLKAYFKQSHGLILVSSFQFNQNVLTLHSDLFFALKNTIKVTSKALLIVQEVEVATYYLFRSENCRKCYRSVYIREFQHFKDLQFCLTCQN